ncbi:unnamed protein product [Zymoseptoria tritici ST99CH_1E4]|uniref:Up-regulated in Daf-2 domain-containing protein n=1 Tax=Zymoseptoria tritici ST99CH_1E4 TaxID=1276532 RepID=A0A2H1H7S2_ZYMTR|nr:unnamed protein product [Zymoseptoria tritici ST99CH_1E4]
MQPSTFFQSLFAFTLLFPLALCGDGETAYVQVINNTPHSISGVGVVHKYSNVYKEEHVYDILQPGQWSSPFEVTYNTGWLTTGRDWWLVLGHNDNDPIGKNSMSQFYTDPENFQDIINWLESAAPTLIGAALTAAEILQPELAAVTAVAGVAAEALCTAMLNDAATAGYKQHILTDEDKGKVLQIWINNDGTVNFISPSGRSDTEYETRQVGLGL